MPSIFVASYSLRVRERLSKTWLPLHFVKTDKKRRMYAIAQQTLTGLKTLQVDEEQQQAVRVSRLNSNETDLWGLVEAGDYGYAASLVNSKTLATSYSKGVDEAEMIPLYFRLHVPDNGTTGIFIIQRLGIRGAYTAVKNALNEAFRDIAAPAHHLGMDRFVPTKVMESLTNGGVKELQVTTRTISPDVTDKILLGGAKEAIAKVEMRFVAKKGAFLTMNAEAWLKKIEAKGTKILEVAEGGTERIRVKVDYKGRNRTYDLDAKDSVAPYVDITDEVKKTKDGHPKFESIDDYCVGLRNELLEQIGQETAS